MQNDISQAIDVLNQGGLILYPTDTIWGIGCDATNSTAVKKVYTLKQRTDTKTMLVLLNNANRLTQYIENVPEMAWELIEVSDKPLTIIYPGAKNISTNLISDDGSIGIRIVKEKFCDMLIQQFKKPIVSTSANISGKPSPAIFQQIAEEIKSGVDYIVKYRQEDTKIEPPSSIIKLDSANRIQILR